MGFKRNADLMVWDNGGKTMGRYTVAIRSECGWDIFAMGRNATGPDGFNQYMDSLTAFSPKAWGKRVAVHSLPKSVQTAIAQRKLA